MITKAILYMILITMFSYCFSNSVRAQANQQEGSLKYYSQIVINDMAGENLKTDIKQVWTTIPGKLMEVPIKVEKGHKYAIGVAGDFWVQSLQCRLINEKGTVLNSIATEKKEEEKNIETMYFIADDTTVYYVQVMLNSTLISDAMMAMIVANE